MSIGTLHLVENALLASSEGATYSTRPPGYPAGASEPSTRAESPEGDEVASGAAGSEAEGAARGPPLRSPRDHGPPGLYAEAPLRGAKANGRPKIDEEKVRERVVVLLESEELMEARAAPPASRRPPRAPWWPRALAPAPHPCPHRRPSSTPRLRGRRASAR